MHAFAYQLSLTLPFYLTANHFTIASDTCTVSSLTTKPENVTELLLESGLQVEYEQRRTNHGLVVRDANLLGCVPTPPTKRPTTS
jgi:hypothetical protein